jgi:hypothetical protein
VLRGRIPRTNAAPGRGPAASARQPSTAPVIARFTDTRTLARQHARWSASGNHRRWGMTDPRTILGQARQGRVPAHWRVFTKKRGKLSGFLRGSSHDPDPLLVITRNGAVEYANERKPLTVLDFSELAGIALQVRGSSFSDSTIVTLDVWIDLHHRDGRKTKWRSTSFADNLQTIQCLIEAYGAHKALREH